MYNHLDRIPACDGWQTDGQTSGHGIVRAMHIHRALKTVMVDNSDCENTKLAVPGLHPHAKFYRFGFINVGLQTEKSLKLVIFGIHLSLNQFLQNFSWGRVSQVPTITLTFTFMALKMWPYGRQNRNK